MNSILEVTNLNKRFNDFALKDISFSLECGYIMGFIGENGAGKTTAIKTILNILVKDSGNVKVLGLDHIKDEKQVKDKVGFVGDERIFYEDITISKMKNIVAPFYSKWDDRKFYSYIERFGLPLDKKIKDLSQGTYKKFAIAMALSHNPELLILDEPTANLDPVFRTEFLDILREFVSDDRHGVLFSTHITSDLEKIADFVTLIHNGGILFTESREALMDRYCIVKARMEMADKLREDYFIGTQSGLYGVETLCRDKCKVEGLLKEGFVIEKPSIEDIMVYTVRGEKK